MAGDYSECLLYLGYRGCILISGELKMNSRIKELRAKHNYTQDDLARKVQVRRETIVFLEQGKYNPSLKLAHDIARVFNLAVEEVFIFDE